MPISFQFLPPDFAPCVTDPSVWLNPVSGMHSLRGCCFLLASPHHGGVQVVTDDYCSENSLSYCNKISVYIHTVQLKYKLRYSVWSMVIFDLSHIPSIYETVWWRLIQPQKCYLCTIPFGRFFLRWWSSVTRYWWTPLLTPVGRMGPCTVSELCLSSCWRYIHPQTPAGMKITNLTSTNVLKQKYVTYVNHVDLMRIFYFFFGGGGVWTGHRGIPYQRMNCEHVRT